MKNKFTNKWNSDDNTLKKDGLLFWNMITN